MVSKNTIVIHDEPSRQRAIAHIGGLNLGIKPWTVTVDPHRKKRSLGQNNLYHEWVGIIANHTGHSHDEVHEWCKEEFLPPRAVVIDGKTREYRSTTGLSTGEMATYMDRVSAFAGSDLGLFLPAPEMTDASGAEITPLGGG